MKKIVALLLAMLMLLSTLAVSAVTTTYTELTATQKDQEWKVSISGISKQVANTVVFVNLLYPGVALADLGSGSTLKNQSAYMAQTLVGADGSFSVEFPLKETDLGGTYTAYVYIPGETEPISVEVGCMHYTRRAETVALAIEPTTTAEVLAAKFYNGVADLDPTAGTKYRNYTEDEQEFIAQHVIEERATWNTAAGTPDEIAQRDANLVDTVWSAINALDEIAELESGDRAAVRRILEADVERVAAGSDSIFLATSNATIRAYAALEQAQKDEVIVIMEIAAGLTYPTDFESALSAAITTATAPEPEPEFSEPVNSTQTGGRDTGPKVKVTDEEMDEIAKVEPPVLEPIDEFTDLATVPWAKNAINILAAKGIVAGRGEGLFCPNDRITRAEFLKLLSTAFEVRMMDEGKLTFTDVDGKAWYYEQVQAFFQRGIVTGISETTFGPDMPITRQDIAVMLHKLNTYLNYKLEETAELPVFADADEIADYAKEAVEALSKCGMISGRDDGSFDPNGTATRAEAITIIYRELFQLKKL